MTKLPTISPSTFTEVRMVSNSLSIGNKIAIASAGKPTDCNTITMVTIPALGIPGAPIEAIIAIKNTTSCCAKLSSIPTKLATNNAAAVKPEYKTQLGLYALVANQLFPGVRVDAAILWTSLELLLELPREALAEAASGFTMR